MDPADSAGPSDEIAEVRARTGYGDIVIRRAGALDPVSLLSRMEDMPTARDHTGLGDLGDRPAQIVRRLTVLDGIDLACPRGRFALLGPTGPARPPP